MKLFVFIVIIATLCPITTSLRRNEGLGTLRMGNRMSPMKWISAFSAICFSVPTFTPSIVAPVFADNRLNAPTAVGTRVNSDPESLLRDGLPMNNKQLRDLQANVEAIKFDLKLRRENFVQSDISTVKGILQNQAQQILSAIPESRRGEATKLIAQLKEQTKDLESVTGVGRGTGKGSIQERESLDQGFILQDNLAKTVGALEELAVSEKFQRFIPEEYQSLPRLNKRATVEMKIRREDGSKFDVFGKLFDEVDLKMVVDGYNSPITAGNFVDLVNKGFYNDKKITRSDGFVVQTGDADPAGKVHGYVPPGAKEERKIPLEIALKGDENLLFGATSEEDGRGASATVLPFQAYGALGMARSEYDADSASSQFFWLLFESDLTPAGKNLLDGRYACFGYTVDGADLLRAVKEGDVIKEAKVIEGLENLKQPNYAQN
mmetsp:Transcript_26887/g.29313  ORF Transcript_26887/g.29313 Transcript_26887/m.29313 type:complete len:435 (+) Transcript_26887:85-1389(+)